jgi:hypothetical protein
LKNRIEEIKYRPQTTQEFIATKGIDKLVPWRHLVLGGMRLKDFSVKGARLYLSSPEVIIPNWNLDENTAPEANLKIWKDAWTNLLWRYRPDPHYSAYWRVLYNRALLAWAPNNITPADQSVLTPLRGSSDGASTPSPSQSGTLPFQVQLDKSNNTQLTDIDNEDYLTFDSSSTDLPREQASRQRENETSRSTDVVPRPTTPPFATDPADLPPHPRWTIDDCNICGAKDSTSHGFLLCPPVQKLWKDSLALLPSLLEDHKVIPLEHANLSLRNIVLCFPDLLKSLPKYKRGRVILWHSAVIYTITQIRTRTIWKSRKHNTRAILQWGDTDKNQPLSQVKFEIRNLLWSIYLKCQFSDLHAIHAFENQWCTGNAWCDIQYNSPGNCTLKFHQ